ncbi:efflux RND transporter periplasmic adaptor subunit [Brachybacterium squillarum]|uniref:efflux RND transporter periplasmic adaptor subunit n=1 Tax=Brachybacterium squillarum TaxID=661979 RepID=UPI002222B57B|nr:efflux RND transporter periplasmic adaptor subunit [Brachybacterium squillarum]MCW1803811.1 efflux RND transporter periplasmic adaptor subunit [Brachybacterium squillarum]
MAALRRYVFPLFWMLILGIIAISLARLAFFPGESSAAEEDPISPSADFDQYATVTASREDISSTLVLPATVALDEGTPLKATAAGEINKVWVKDGDEVQEGTKILQVRVPVEADPVEVAATDDAAATTGGTDGAEDGTEAEEVAAPAAPATSAPQEYRYLTLVADGRGIVRDLTAVEWETVSVGDTVATLSPGTYSITADLTPEQQLSLLDVDIEATATLPSLTDPITCSRPAVTEDDPSADDDQAPSSEGASIEVDPMTGEEITPETTSAQLSCAVPEGTRVVSGLTGEVSVALGTAEGVLTVPTTAVEGEGEAGTVYTLDEATGEPTPLEVELGLRGDGVVEVRTGLEEGQEILQYVPGVDSAESGMDGMEVW